MYSGAYSLPPSERDYYPTNRELNAARAQRDSPYGPQDAMSEAAPLLPDNIRASADDPTGRPWEHVFAQDGLLKKADRTLHQKKFKQEPVFWAIMALFSACSVFCGIASVLVYFLYNRWPLVLVVYVFSICIASEFVVRFAHPRVRWHLWCGPMVAFGTVLGTLVGLILFYDHWNLYFHYHDLPKFTDIAGSQSAAQFSDAGMLEFSQDTQLDTTRAVGYRNSLTGKTLCVAPIVDISMGAEDPVTWFAVGVDCCDWRANFNCAKSPKDTVARSGLALLEPELISQSGAMQAFLPPVVDFAGFDQAIKLEQAVFGTVVGEKTRLLTWTNDPMKLAEDIWWEGLFCSLIYGAMCLIISAVVATFAACGRERIGKSLPIPAWYGRTEPQVYYP